MAALIVREDLDIVGDRALGHYIGRRSRQVWTSQNRCEVLFFLNRESHAPQIWPTPKPACSFLTVPRSKLYDPPKWWNQGFVMLQLA